MGCHTPYFTRLSKFPKWTLTFQNVPFSSNLLYIVKNNGTYFFRANIGGYSLFHFVLQEHVPEGWSESHPVNLLETSTVGRYEVLPKLKLREVCIIG